jgi:hypothetical protein
LAAAAEDGGAEWDRTVGDCQVDLRPPWIVAIRCELEASDDLGAHEVASTLSIRAASRTGGGHFAATGIAPAVAIGFNARWAWKYEAADVGASLTGIGS